MLIDCHAHLNDRSFDADRDEVVRRAAAAGLSAILVVGEDREDNRGIEEVCRAAAGGGCRLLPCYGFHPDRFADDRPLPGREEIEAFLGQVREAAASLAAIGEVGLDRWVARSDDRRRAQAGFLEEVAALALELGLPLNVHSRSAGHYTLDLLHGAGVARVLMHAFDGKAGHAVRAAGKGFFFSIPPSVARSPQKQKLVRALPLGALALESDAPILGPERDRRNEPANVGLVRDAIAEIHGIPADEVAAATTRNAGKLFGTLFGLSP